MKRLVSLALAAVLVSYCGTAPQSMVLSDATKTEVDGRSSEYDKEHYVTTAAVGVAVGAVVLCTVVPGARRVCQKQFMSSDSYLKKLKELQEGASEKRAAKLQEEIDKLSGSGKDGIFFTAYDKTIGKLVRKLKKTDEASSSADEAGKTSDEASSSADEAGKTSDEASSSADEAGKTSDEASEASDEASSSKKS